MKIIDLTGQRFGMLVVTDIGGRDKYGRTRWKCRCDCGSVVEIGSNNLRTGNTKSCGCHRAAWLMSGAAQRTHGMTGTGAHKSWLKMIERCTDPSNNRFRHYGARGIRVCREWMEFENFYRDMGDRPPGKSIDRIDVERGYCKDNCRWATTKEQASNKRKKPDGR